MQTLRTICRSIIKKNKGFSICLCLMSLLSFATSILAANFANCANATISNFFSYTGVPDVLITTNFIDTEILEDIKNIDGISSAYDRLIYDVNIETKEKKQFSSRLLTYDENEPYKLEYQERIEIIEDEINTYVSYEFADYNHLDLGDKFLIFTPIGEYEVRVSAKVASVETFNCVKDEMSNYETYEFGYIYIPKVEFAKIMDLSSITNNISLYFDTNLSKEEQHTALDKVKQLLDEDFISSFIISELPSIKSINDDVNTIKVLCVFIPGVVFLITLGFCFGFLKIVINNQRKTIALLKSLGYSSAKVTGIFILYTVLINASALIIGLPLGFLLLRVCVGLIASANGILTIAYDISILLTIALILLVFVIGILASLFTSKLITKVDPVFISNTFESNNEVTPKLVQKIKCDPFVKISFASILRRYKRFIVGFLCIATCIITMCVGFEGNITISYPKEAVYGERFKYDLMVRDISDDDYLEIKTNIDDVEVIEPLCFFKANVNENEVVVSSIIKDSELVILKNAKGNIIFPSDGVIIDEMYAHINNINIGDEISLGEHSLVVNEIAREIAVPIFYISQETAENIFSESINCALLKAKNTTNIENIKKEIININSSSYFSLLSSQKENMNNRSIAIRSVMLILSLLSFLIGSLFIFNITIIDFNEKKTDYITLSAIGASANKLSLISFVENLIRVLAGIVIAIPLSYLANTILLKLLSSQSAQYIMIHFWPSLFIAVAISLLYIIISVLISKRIIKKINLAEKLSEDE